MRSSTARPFRKRTRSDFKASSSDFKACSSDFKASTGSHPNEETCAAWTLFVETIPHGADDDASAALIAASRSPLPAAERDQIKDLAVARATRLTAVTAVFSDALAQHMNRVGLPLEEEGIDDSNAGIEIVDHTFSRRGNVTLEDLCFRVAGAAWDDDGEDLCSGDSDGDGDGWSEGWSEGRSEGWSEGWSVNDGGGGLGGGGGGGFGN